MCYDSFVCFVLFIFLLCISYFVRFSMLFNFRTLVSLPLVRRYRLDDSLTSIATIDFRISSRDTIDVYVIVLYCIFIRRQT